MAAPREELRECIILIAVGPTNRVIDFTMVGETDAGELGVLESKRGLRWVRQRILARITEVK